MDTHRDNMYQSVQHTTYLWDFMHDTITFSKTGLQILHLDKTTHTNMQAFWKAHIHTLDYARVNKQFENMYFHNKDEVHCLFQFRTGHEQYIWVKFQGSITRDVYTGRLLSISGSLFTDTEYVDTVTGLSLHAQGKRSFEILSKKKISVKCGLMLLGIDDFSTINTLNDHGYGDYILRTFVQEAYQMLPMESKMYRYDGDQFIIFIENIDLLDMKLLYTAMKEHMLSLNTFIELSYRFSFSAGIVMFPKHGTNWNDLLNHAAIALKKAKEEGKDRFVVYNKEMLTEKMHEQFINKMMVESVHHNCKGFRVIYQPICEADTLHIHGAEALLRFDAPNGKTMQPDAFIPLLESNRLIIPVGAWVLEQAIITCKKWCETISDFVMNVNLSYIQLQEPNFVTDVEALLKKHQMEPKHLVLELTESYFSNDIIHINHATDQIKAMGIKLAMDDFGTGYSSLARLTQFHVDIVKIDKLFVQSLQTSSYTQDFIEAVVRLCHNVGLKVCVEGVETRLEQKQISLMRADYIQGYYVSQPMDADEFYKAYIKREIDTTLLAVSADNELRARQLVGDAYFLQVLLDTVPLALIIWNRDAEIISCNRKALELYGVNDVQELKTDFHQFSPLKQADGINSQDKVKLKIQEGFLNGSASFLWQHLDAQQNCIPCEVICTRIIYHNDYILVSYTNDIRKQIAAKEQMRKLNSRIRALLDATPLCVNLWNEKQELIMCNQEAVNLFSLENEQQYVNDFMHLSPAIQPNGKRSVTMVYEKIQQAFDQGSATFHWMHCNRSGEKIPTEIKLVRIDAMDDDGGNLVAGYTRDIRQQLKIADMEKKSNQRVRAVLNANPLACLVWSYDGYCIDCNDVAINLFEASSKEALLYHFHEFQPLYQLDGKMSTEKFSNLLKEVKTAGKVTFEWLYVNQNKEHIPCEVTLVALYALEEKIIVSYSRDLRELKETLKINARLSQLAYFDVLTGCSSRASFMELLEADFHRDAKNQLALAMIDLDDFKQINDAYGHEAGDIALQKTIRIISSMLPRDAILGRYGGDEFILMTKHVAYQALQHLLNDIVKRIAHMQIKHDTVIFHVSISIGAAFQHANHDQIDALMKRSDNALYQAKRAGKNQAIILHSEN